MSKALRTLKEENKMAVWSGRIRACRESGQTVKAWCKENGVCEPTYYKWQKRLLERVQEPQELQFVEIASAQPVCAENVAVTVRVGGAEADIHCGADASTVETVLRVLKSC